MKVEEVMYRETGYDTELVSKFHCNDPFFNELWKRSVRTMYVNMRDTYFDCPDRERSQWWGDIATNVETRFGFIRVSLQQHDDNIHLTLTVPQGTTATIHIGNVTRILQAGMHGLDVKS